MNVSIFIVIAYFAITMLLGVLASKKSRGHDAFVGSGTGVFAIVCVACGQWLGGTSTTGCSECGFQYGLSGWWYTIANGVGMLMMALFFAERYRRCGEVTIPGIIEKLIGPRSRTVCSALLILVMLAVGLSQMIAAGKLGVSMLGLRFDVSCCLFSVIFILYTMSGGMKSVEATNKLHLAFMYAGMILAVALAVARLGGWSSFAGELAVVDAEEGTRHFSLSGIGASEVISQIVASVLSAGAAQASIQPVLAARDPASAKKACLISVFVVVPFGLFTTLLGMAAKAMNHAGLLAVTDAKLAYTDLIMSFHPILSGVILASVLAAILSTISPIILASATMFTRDIYARRASAMPDERQLMRVSRIGTAASGVLCCALAVLLANASTILSLVKAAYTLRGILFIVILFGLFWVDRRTGATKASDKGVCLAVLTSFAGCIAWFIPRLTGGQYLLSFGSFAVTETSLGVILACVTIVSFSRLFPRPPLSGGQEKIIS